MAARGHVQDPNDRRLRPIYGEHSMGSCTVLHVWMSVECLWDLTMRPLLGVPGCYESRGAALRRPHRRRPRSLLPAAPNDSAPYPVYHIAGVGHGSQVLFLKTMCPVIRPVITRSRVRALNVPDPCDS